MRRFFKIIKITSFIFIIFLNFNFFSIKIANSSDDCLQKVTNEGDLIIRGNEVFVIDNQEFTQHGNIRISENGKLAITNSTFYFQQGYHEEFNWWVSNYGSIEIKNSKMLSPYRNQMYLTNNSSLLEENSVTRNEPGNWGTFFYVVNNSSLIIVNSRIDGLDAWSPGFRANPGDLAKIEILDTEINQFGLNFIENSVASIDGLKEGLMSNWQFPISGSGVPYQISFKNVNVRSATMRSMSNSQVYINECRFSQLGVQDVSSVEIKNSEISQMCPLFSVGNLIELSDLKPGYIEYLDFKSKGTGVPINLTIIKTNINDGWYIRVWIDKFIIKNSHILRMRPERNCNAELYNCIIDQIDFAYSTPTVFFKDSIIKDWFYVMSCDVKFRGYVKIEKEYQPDPMHGPCREVKINREFPVWPVYQCHRSAGIDLHVLDPDGNEIWSGYTNQEGEGFFSVLFTCDNYNKEYTLKSNTLGKEIKFKMSSSTPLIIPSNNPPKLQTIGNKTAYTGKEIKFKVNATDPENCPLTYKASPLPQGAFINSSTGEFSWIPNYSQIGIHKIRFSVTDGIDEVYEDINITVTKRKKGEGRI